MTCPFCEGEFETTRLRATALRVREKWSDFGCDYEGYSPYFYSITACSHCQIAARNDEFEKFLPAYEPKLMEVSRKLRATPKPDIFKLGELDLETVVKRHEMALAIHKYRAVSDMGELAGLHMHLVWIFRVAGDKARELKAMEQATAAYQEYFEKGGKLPEKLGEPGVMYLIGELYRKQGKIRDARVYFSRALQSKELGAFPHIENILREAMLSTKDPHSGG